MTLLHNLQTRMVPVLFTLAFIVVCQLVSTVRAMCVYNNTNIEIYVEFDCGTFCGNEWTTEPNNSYCRPSTSGTLLTDFIGVTFDEAVANVCSIVPLLGMPNRNEANPLPRVVDAAAPICRCVAA